MEAYDYQNEVEDLIEDQDESGYIMQDETWRINSMDLAVWADSLIHDKEERIAEIENVANNNIQALEAKVEKLKQWKEDSTKKDQSDIAFFKEHLHLWHMNTIRNEKHENTELVAIDKEPKKLSLTVKLPYRNLTCRAQQPVITLNGKEIGKAKDDAAFVQFVKENSPEFIQTTEEVKWGEYKKTLKMIEHNGKMIYVDGVTGDPLEFIDLKKQDEKYDWKIKH
ncbi:host-nuclease inhibitor Gam family protein [Paenibacillus odorifer]|uniref:host-nuclease inhibitor Gam family protein n=1 Tax=Paenibacillus odorifer TaxID=189426 RepID=UPI00096C85CD|nr:host-nuclease inhibitor Gam family protein [Paenibacillus odorifer]OMD66906.1 hypothetical protein BSK50_30485 [Paenibacillus odorifer]